MSSNHYLILGVTRDATTEEIRAAYLRLARSSHPDLNPGDAEAALKFKSIQLAYETLTNATAREQYDKGHVKPNATVVYATANRGRTGPVATEHPTSHPKPKHPHTGGSYTFTPRTRKLSDWLSVMVPAMAALALCIVVTMHVSEERAKRLSQKTTQKAKRQIAFESYKERREKLWTQLARESEERHEEDLEKQVKASSGKTQSKIDWQEPDTTETGLAREDESSEMEAELPALFAESDPTPPRNLFEIDPDAGVGDESFKSELLPSNEINPDQLEALDDFYAQLDSESFELKNDNGDELKYDAFENLPPPSPFKPARFNSLNSTANYTPGAAFTTQLDPSIAFDSFTTPGFTPPAPQAPLPRPRYSPPVAGAAAGTWNPATNSGQFTPEFASSSHRWQPNTPSAKAPQMRTPIAPSLIPPINRHFHNPYRPTAPGRPTVGMPGIGRNF